MTVTRYQIGRSPFNPLTSFLAYATGDEEITLKENSVAKIEKLTPAQESRLAEYRDRFLAYGLSTEPADRAAAEDAVKDAYRAGGLEPPTVFIWLPSPMAGAIGAAMLANKKVGAQVRAQVWAQVRAQVGDQVWAQVGAQVRDQVWAQVGAQVRDQVWAQVRAQVRAQVGAQVRDQVWAQVRDQVWRAGYGQHDAGWMGFYSYFAEVAGVADAARLAPLSRLSAAAGWWWPFENLCIITDRPSVLSRDAENRLHSECGPAIQYRDGWGVYAWHGQRIPEEWITDRDSLTAEKAVTWPNVEQRAAACEILGWHHIISSLKPKVIDEDPDPQIGRLVEINLPDHGPQKFIHAMCGTGREIAVMADAKANTVLEAQAASYGLTAKDFLVPEIRT